MTSAAKQIIREADAKITQKTALELSCLEPEQQEEAASMLVAKEIHSIGEYQATKENQESQKDIPDQMETETAQPIQELTLKSTLEKPEKEISSSLPTSSSEPVPDPLPFVPVGKQFSTFEEGLADLKDPEKDCSCTADGFLAEITAFVQDFRKEITWYNMPYYEVIFPSLTPTQFDYLRQQMELICGDAQNLLQSVERSLQPHELS